MHKVGIEPVPYLRYCFSVCGATLKEARVCMCFGYVTTPGALCVQHSLNVTKSYKHVNVLEKNKSFSKPITQFTCTKKILDYLCTLNRVHWFSDVWRKIENRKNTVKLVVNYTFSLTC